MNKKPPVKLRVDELPLDVLLRMKALHHNARRSQRLFVTATRAAEQSSLTIPELLRRIGREGIKRVEGGKKKIKGGIEYNATQSVDELAFLDELLNAIADGRDVAKELRFDRPKHRKASPLNIDISYLRDDLADLPGMNQDKAERLIGVLTALSPDAVKEQAKAGKKRTKAIRARMDVAEQSSPKAAAKKEK